MPFEERKAANSFDRNSPALSLWNVPTTREGPPRRLRFRSAVEDAMKARMAAGASLLVRSRWTALKRVWSSTSTSAYWYPSVCERKNGPAMSACIRRPGAGFASAEVALRERRRRISRDVGQVAQTGGARVKASMHVVCGVIRRHHPNV
eukprot:2360299-Pleurochrysis_carterae.AAC.1